jgi:hypothetical protein
MMKTLMFLIVLAVACNPGFSQAKGGNDQYQIILLNDSAAALEDSNPGLSKILAKFADEKEKEWEDKNANKNGPQAPIKEKDSPSLQYRIKFLKAAALAIEPTYPLMAKGLNKMANDIGRTIEIEK